MSGIGGKPFSRAEFERFRLAFHPNCMDPKRRNDAYVLWMERERLLQPTEVEEAAERARLAAIEAAKAAATEALRARGLGTVPLPETMEDLLRQRWMADQERAMKRRQAAAKRKAATARPA